MSHCYSFSSCENRSHFPGNTGSDFRNLFNLDNLNGEYSIALDVIIPSTFLARYKGKRCSVQLDAIKEQENGCDRCIYSYVLEAKKEYHPVFIPLLAKKFTAIHIELINSETGMPFSSVRSENAEHTFINFEVKRVFHGQKIFYANFKTDLDKFPGNTPLHFTNLVNPIFANNIDFTEWELTLNSIFINDVVLKKSSNRQPYFTVCTNVIEMQMLADKQKQILITIPNSWDSAKKHFSYRPVNNIYLDMNVRNLTSITIDVDLFKDDAVSFTADELKTCELIVSFVLRNKKII